MAKRRASLDAIVEFRHEGKLVQVKVKKSEWKGGADMLYTWETTDGKRTFQTKGVPKPIKVIADVPRGHRTALDADDLVFEHLAAMHRFTDDDRWDAYARWHRAKRWPRNVYERQFKALLALSRGGVLTDNRAIKPLERAGLIRVEPVRDAWEMTGYAHQVLAAVEDILFKEYRDKQIGDGPAKPRGPKQMDLF